MFLFVLVFFVVLGGFCSFVFLHVIKINMLLKFEKRFRKGSQWRSCQKEGKEEEKVKRESIMQRTHTRTCNMYKREFL